MTDNLLVIVQTLGGIGLFLLGMIVMTDGLRTLAGNAIRAALMRFTRSPYHGAATGAIATAILQSSSVTTLAAVVRENAGRATDTVVRLGDLLVNLSIVVPELVMRNTAIPWSWI